MPALTPHSPAAPALPPEVARELAHALRFLSVDAVQKANSGHPGAPMGLADVATAIWSQGLRFDPDDPTWEGRDRFVLSCGHASMLLYSLLHLWGVSLSREDLEQFRQLGSLTPGHPEVGHTPGVEMTTGPLGQGCATSVGLALAAERLAQQVTAAGGGDHHPYLGRKTITLCSDGDLMEGISYEAASLAGHWALSDLIWFYDDNRISIDGETSLSFSEDVADRFFSMGWRVLRVDGHDPARLADVVQQAWSPVGRPTLVICRTHIGFGSPNKVDRSSSHGSPLGSEEIALTREALGWSHAPFELPERVTERMKALRAARVEGAALWRTEHEAWAKRHPEAAQLVRSLFNRDAISFEATLDELLKETPRSGATRKLSNDALDRALELFPRLMGGSADLSGSNGLSLKDPSFGQTSHHQKLSPRGRTLHFGVREHAMGAITNGLTLHGSGQGFCGTFLVFSDYLRPAIRVASLSHIPSVYVLSHDSVFLGEDGPTHQPIEHTWALRIIPGVTDFRPADGAEVAAAWAWSISEAQQPVALMLTRQTLGALPHREDFHASEVIRGAYLVNQFGAAGTEGQANSQVLTMVGTGSEVELCVSVAEVLASQGMTVRVISMPSVRLFMAQDPTWREELLGSGPRVSVEAGSTLPWAGVLGAHSLSIGIDQFGASAPMEALAEHFGLTTDQVTARITAWLNAR